MPYQLVAIKIHRDAKWFEYDIIKRCVLLRADIKNM